MQWSTLWKECRQSDQLLCAKDQVASQQQNQANFDFWWCLSWDETRYKQWMKEDLRRELEISSWTHKKVRIWACREKVCWGGKHLKFSKVQLDLDYQANESWFHCSSLWSRLLDGLPLQNWKSVACHNWGLWSYCFWSDKVTLQIEHRWSWVRTWYEQFEICRDAWFQGIQFSYATYFMCACRMWLFKID